MENLFEIFFGTDFEKEARLEKLRNSKTIEITGDEVPYNEDLRQYRKNALEYGRNLRGKYINKNTEEIIVLTSSKKNGGLKEILQHDYQDKEHIQSVAAIPKIIENAIFITELLNEDNLKHPNTASYRYYACGLKISGVSYTVKMVVGVMDDGSKYYDHRLTQVEKSALIDIIQTVSTKNSPNHANGLASPSLQLGEGKTGEILSPPLTDYKDKRLISILQTKVVKKIGEVELSFEQQKLLAAGDTIRIEDVADKAGKKQTAYVRWNAEKGSPEFF
jgi:hypothetical protein